MNFLKGTGDLAQGMMTMMNNNNWSASNQKESKLRSNLEGCTYPDQTKYMIEKAVKQVFHVYPFFDVDVLMFTEGGYPKRYIELKGILEVDIKGKNCKVDFNMMIPSDYPRSSPFVRIVNRNPDYRVDPFYQNLQSKTDKSSYILNQKLNSVKNWHPSNSLVNVIMESYEILKTKFPFTKPVADKPGFGGGGGNPWDKMYDKGGNNNNFGGGGFANNNNANSPNTDWVKKGWGGTGVMAGNNNWNQPNNNNVWGNPGNANSWGNQGGWGGGGQGHSGGMGGIMGNNNNNATGAIAAGQKLVGMQKQTLGQMSNFYANLLAKNQHLDLLRLSLQAQQSTLRRQNFEMTNFLNNNQKSKIPDLTNIVQPANELSEQILQLLSSIKAREECLVLLQGRFNDEQIKLEEFMKLMRKIEETRFEQKALLQKCLSHAK